MKINQILPQENNFTKVLSTIEVMPKRLFYYGKIPEKRSDQDDQRIKCVGIVGARKYSSYGEEIAYRVAYDVAKEGVVVISGLALGIDSIAHRGALAANGTTVAVLGTAIDQIYPRRHQNLAEEIVAKNGLILSEYARGAGFYKTQFLERNRLIAGLSDVILVVEAGERSGSLNTALHGLEQGKEVMAVPGDINRPTSQGCNRLIRQGATPFTKIEDLWQVLWPEKLKKEESTKSISGDTPEETAVLKLLFTGIREGEELLEKLKIPVSEFNQLITLLEIKGRVRSLGANRWTL
ncbi:MAG: DNA-processing protein DprA [Candidatus Saccharibacteria bacterium]|nr:DNA-processing protein DprA [Candidatus Saccharibacteria bacterium]